MKIHKTIVPLLLAITLFGCGKPVPAEKSAYVGEWQEKTMYLLITQDGSVRYKRLKDGGSTSVEGPLKGFDGNNFEAGIGPLATTFIVSKPPYQDGDKWKMVVDDVELIKTAAPPAPAKPAIVDAKPSVSPPSVTASVPVPSATHAPITPSVADEPEAIYAKFHSAGLAANFDEMLKYGTAQKGIEGASMPVEMRQAMLGFLAQILPKSYSVASKTIDPDGNHAMLRVTALQSQHPGDIPDTVNGTITLIKENGGWKVDEAKWGEPSKISKPINRTTINDVDISTWADVQNDNSIYAYNVYLNMFPQGKYAKQAKSRIKKLEKLQRESADGSNTPSIEVAIVTGTKVKRQLSAKEDKEQSPTVTDGGRAIVTVPDSQYQAPPKNVITPKFNDVMTAVMRQDQAAVTQLLDLGWWVDKPGSGDFTPLMEAVAMGDAPMAELLLKHGANPNAAARDGSMLQIAKRNRDSVMEVLLRRYGATVD